MKRILLVISILAVLLCSFALAVDFTDVAGHWGEPYIKELTDKGVINGYLMDDGTYEFRPEGEIKKGEFLKLIMSASLPSENWSAPSAKYPNHWSGIYIEKAEEYEVIDEGYVNEQTAEDKISRADVAEILGKCDIVIKNSPQLSAEYEFYDVADISIMQKVMLAHCVAKEYIKGYDEYTFGPNNTLKRAEVATILSRYMK